jgi:hypothetical protein
MTKKACQFWLASVASVVVLCSRVSAGDVEELKREIELAQRCYYDGDFSGAIDACAAAKKLLANDEVRKDLYEDNVRWQAVECQVLSMQAVIRSEQGDFASAEAAIKQAKAVKGRSKEDDAWIDVANGDLLLARAGILVPVGDLGDDWQKQSKTRAAYRVRAKKFYETAREVMNDVGINTYGGDNGYRLSSRINAGLGRILSGSAAAADSGARKAMAFAKRQFDDAESDLRNTKLYSDILAPNTKWPLSLKQLLLQMEQKKLSDSDQDAIHREYSRVIQEWVRLQCDRAELAAVEAAATNAQGPQLAEAEAFFRKAKDMCVEHFGPRHPNNSRIDLSQAVFYLGRAVAARDMAKKGQGGDAREQLKAQYQSFFWDAIFVAESARKTLSDSLDRKHPLRVDALLLELTALDQGQAVASRPRQEIVEEINALLGK